jgi:SlyX protein
MTGSMPVHEQRLDELEAKLAWAEDLIETLNETVIRQQRQMDSLQKQLRLLHQQILDSRTDAHSSPHEEMPPHY